MVGPSPHSDIAKAKAQLRKHFRALRREHVDALPKSMRALLFMRPPVPLVQMIPANACVGLYYPTKFEAPALAYSRWLHENGHTIALPRFTDRTSPMAFHVWENPYDEDALDIGPFGVPQPTAQSAETAPNVLVMPLVAFTAQCTRLGQGGGHYDRWLEAHPDTLTIGLAWDAQLADALPIEPHDHPLAAVVTPTRLYEGAR